MISGKAVVVTLALIGAVACGESTSPAGPTTTLTINLCSSFSSGWFAYQNDGGAWTRLTPDADGRVTFDATSKVSVAMSRTLTTLSFTSVINATSAELQSALGTSCVDDSGAKFLTGALAGLSGEQVARVSGGPATDVGTTPDPTFRLEGLTGSAIDIIATRYPTISSQPASRAVVRRGVVPADGAIAALDFASVTESASLQSEIVTFTGAGANAPISMSTTVRTANGTSHPLSELSSGAGVASFNYVSLPASLRIASDRHTLSAVASSASSTRGVTRIYSVPGPLTLAFGPTIDAPQLAAIETPYIRPQATVASKAEYPSAVRLDANESSASTTRIVSVMTTAAFLGGTPTTWSVAFPDMSAANFPVAAALKSKSFTFAITAIGGDVASALGGTAADGTTSIFAIQSGQVTPTAAAQAIRSP